MSQPWGQKPKADTTGWSNRELYDDNARTLKGTILVWLRSALGSIKLGHSPRGEICFRYLTYHLGSTGLMTSLMMSKLTWKFCTFLYRVLGG